MKNNISTPQSVKRNSADHPLGDIIKSPSIHGEGDEMSLFIQQYPEEIAKQFSLLVDLQQKKEDALATAKSAKDAANNMKGYVKKKFLGHEYKSGNDKDIIEDIQNVLKSIAEAEEKNASAQETSFEFQEALSKSTELLFMMGCVNTAANEAMIEQIVSIRDNKTTLGKYQLTKEVKERILGVAQRLKVQQNIMARQNKHQTDIKNLTETIQTKQDKIEGLEEIKSNAAKGATALQPSDISEWAKKKEKPSYTAKEVGALSSSTFIPTKVSDLENDEGFLTEHQDISMKADSTTVEQSLRQKVDKTTYTQTIQELNSKLTETIQTKQDKIEGLEDIKSNAAKGATALQPNEIANWAKQKDKPSYSAQEVGALSSSTFIPTKVSDLENDEGFLTEHQDISMKADSTKVEQALALKVDETTYSQTIQELNSKLTETIQTKQDKIEGLEEIKSNAAKGATALQPSDISDWAKAKEKPSYTAKEVGALSSSTFIPTKVSDLENDEGFLTEHQDISMKADSKKVEQALALKVDETSYKITIGELSYKLATNQKITITSLVIGGLSFIGMVALIAKFIFLAM